MNYLREETNKTIKIARKYDKPIIASDDSNWPGWIGRAYNEFSSDKINFESGLGIVKSLVDLIEENNPQDFSPVQNYVNFKDWFKWVIWEYAWREQFRKTKQKFYKNN